MPVTVEGKNAVVIGGTSGIGRAIALGFAADGADVITTSRSEEKVAEAAAEIREFGAETAEVTCDVTDRSSVEELCEVAIDALGSIDVLVNSAGGNISKPLMEITDEDWRTVIDTQLTGVFYATQTFAESMDEGSSIINVSSFTTIGAMRRVPAYAAAKGGVDTFTRIAAKELGPDIRVNAVRPGFILTPLTAEGFAEGTNRHEEVRDRTYFSRIGRPEEITGAAIYLASDAATYTTGDIITIDGGFAHSAFE